MTDPRTAALAEASAHLSRYGADGDLKYPDSPFYMYEDADRAATVVEQLAKETTPAAPARPLETPFFEVGKTYRHTSQHGSEGIFLVEFVGRAPEDFEHHSETGGVAFGWRKRLHKGVMAPVGEYSTTDFAGWTEIDGVV